MKNTLLALLGFILLASPLTATAQQFGDFTYTSDGSAITITGYTGPGGAVVIPDTINGLPVTHIGTSAFASCISLASVTIPKSVTSIGDFALYFCSSLASVTISDSVTHIGASAFAFCTSLTNVTIPNSVTNIWDSAFISCTRLSAITVDVLNSVYSSVDGVLFNKSQTLLIEYPGGKAGSYTIPNSVTSIADRAFLYCSSLAHVTIPNSVIGIGWFAFDSCTGLTSVTIPNSVTSIGYQAFGYCTNLTGVYFQGNPPAFFGISVFDGADNATVYYMPETTGWGATFGGRPAVLWNPLVQTGDASFGVRTNRFGFTITGTANIPLVVEASATLVNPSWVALQSFNLTNGAFYFTDPNWTNYPARIYRIRSP